MGKTVNESAQKKNYVYNSLFADIVRNIYDSSTIITEKMIIEKYQVSKSPVREALQTLCIDGILESIPRLGYRVLPISLKDTIDATNFRIIIETSALEKSFPEITEEMIEILRKIYIKEKEIESSKDPYTHWELNTTFHLTLCSYSDNRFFTNTVENLMKTCFRGVHIYYEQSFMNDLKREDSKYHAWIIKALEQKDLDTCKSVLIKDIEEFKSDLLLKAVT